MITGRHRSLVVMVGLALICSTAWAETPGEHFRKAMAKKAEYCASDQHKIDPANRRCDILNSNRPTRSRPKKVASPTQ